jgi:hypothetical protein
MTKLQSFLLLILLFFLANSGLAQQPINHEKAILHLIDGSVYIGNIIDEDLLSLRMVVTTGDTVRIAKELIRRKRRTNKNIQFHTAGKFHFTKGFFVSIHLGIGMNLSQVDSEESGQFDMLFGYRFNKKIATGIGAGISISNTRFAGEWIEANTIPVFAYGRYYPFDVKAKPFGELRLGWAFPNEQAFQIAAQSGGILIQPGIGINFASRKNLRFLIGFNQLIQHSKGERVSFDPFGNRITSKFNIWFNRTVLRIALEWK